MAGYLLVRQARGPAWDPSRGRREQSGWNDHAAFIDRLSEDGRIPLGGPLGDIDGEHTVLVVHATSGNDARATFDDDPWTDSILKIESVEPWTLWIGADRLPSPRKLRPRVESLAALPAVEALARRPLRDRVTGSVWGMPNDGIDGAVDLPDAVLHGVELAANHAREVRPSREDELSRAVSSQREEVEGCFRTGDPERAIESIVRARQ